MLSLSHTFHV